MVVYCLSLVNRKLIIVILVKILYGNVKRIDMN